MKTLIEDLAVILPAIAIVSVLFVVFLNIYLAIRRRIPVKVNCWFCNCWTKVDYNRRNCFECPSCLQYNGFNQEGDYNKPIPAHYDNLLNRDVTYNQQNGNKSPPASNGLCSSCNNNMRLKVFQLANFIPLNENNYDLEIEHFEQQLDKSYRLCASCEIIVKTTLRKQNEILGIKLPNLRKRGIRLLDFNSYSTSRRNLLIKAITCFVVTIACCNIAYILWHLDYSDDNVKKFTPVALYPYVIRLKELFVNVQHKAVNLFEDVFPDGQKYFIRDVPNFEYNAKLLCCLGGLLQLLLVFLSNDGRFKKILEMATWGLITWLSWNYPVSNNYNVYGQLIANFTIIAAVCVTSIQKPKPKKKIKRKSSHKTKSPKTNNSWAIKRETPKTQLQEFTKPHYEPDVKFPKNFLSYNEYNNPVVYKDKVGWPLHLPDDLLTNLTKLNLGKPTELQNIDYENPFLKVRPPLYRTTSATNLVQHETYPNRNNYFPSIPSSVTVRLQFSTRRVSKRYDS